MTVQNRIVRETATQELADATSKPPSLFGLGPQQARKALDDLQAGLPPTLVDEADVLRDEGEAYAAKHRQADVAVTTVRYDGTAHDFMLLNSLSDTRATRAAIAQATSFLRAALGT